MRIETMMNLIIINLCKFLSLLINSLSLGHGSTWPGHIALIINPNFIRELITNNQNLQIVLIAGTNGKTTTSKLLQHILEKNSHKVFINKTGANLLNGVASTLIKFSDGFGSFPYDTVIFEIDENTLPLILKEVNNPKAITILNLFRDQLDRYGEVNTIAGKWIKSLEKIDKSTLLILNGDDPQISFLGNNRPLNTHYFGIDKKLMSEKETSHDVDSIYCPVCTNKLTYNLIAYSHLGDFMCNKCGYKRKTINDFADIDSKLPLLGKYNIYNTNAAILTANTAFNIPLENILKNLKDFKPAFGRQEIIKYKNKNILVLLSKNPTGFNQSIEAINDIKINSKNVLLVLNDRIPDGRDISWIWDVDFERLSDLHGLIYVSGDRTYDMAIRLKYAGFKQESLKINTDLKESIEHALKEIKADETLYILPTYSAMLEVRKILSGKKLI